MLAGEARAAVREALRHIEEALLQAAQDKLEANHGSIKPGASTLDEITYRKGLLDGWSECVLQLQEWAGEG